MSHLSSKVSRLVALFMSFAFAVIGVAVGANALVQANETTASILRRLPSGITVVVNDRNIRNVGTVISAVCAFIALITLLLLLGTLAFERPHRPRGILASTAGAQGGVLAFCTVWLLAAMIAFDIIFNTKEFSITAIAFGQPIDPSVAQTIASGLGVSTRYRDYHFLLLLAILPWFTVLFTGLVAVILLASSSGRSGSDDGRALRDKPMDM